MDMSTNNEAPQLVLFPDEQFEYIAVDMKVFKGDIIDGKMAVEENFRKRFKYHDTASVMTTMIGIILGNERMPFIEIPSFPKPHKQA
ncbi:hypothetical protein D3C85_1741630 [compost metagenome]